MYVGGGNKTGNNGISYTKSGRNKNLSDISQYIEDDFYVKYKDDLRLPCEELYNPISDHISKNYKPGGTWAYAYSLKGAKNCLN
jgi:hypothetical protein